MCRVWKNTAIVARLSLMIILIAYVVIGALSGTIGDAPTWMMLILNAFVSLRTCRGHVLHVNENYV